LGGLCFRGWRFKEGEKEVDSGSEGDVVFGHDEVDRVEVFVAAETSGEVALGIGGRVKLVTKWTHEAKEALGDLAREFEEVGDDEVDGDIVSKEEEGLSWDAVGHDGSFLG
jgi:hypothetical protein